MRVQRAPANRKEPLRDVAISDLGDLGRHAFLDLQACGERGHNARKLGNSDYPPVGYASYVGTANDGCNVMVTLHRCRAFGSDRGP
jgi:hypothetical protein